MDLDLLLDRVASVVAECVGRSGTEDLPFLDMIILSLRSTSCDVGRLLDAIIVTREIQLEDPNVLSSLRELHVCLNQLCMDYERKLLVLSADPSRNTPSDERLGRPRKIINIAFVEMLREMHYTWQQVADALMVSRSTLWRRLTELGIPISTFSNISDTELDGVVELLVKDFPNYGIVMMWGQLKSMNIIVSRDRVRESLVRVSPHFVNYRRSSAVTRRVYSVPSSNFLWHIDGLHCLIRWKIVIHGGIDGYSRRIVYLHASCNNRAETVFRLFRDAVTECGWPSRVRSDKGGENVDVARAMLAVRGSGRNSHITGSSVHNQRIERLWRDTFRCVGQVYYALFYEMEDSGVLNPDYDGDLFSLHYVFLPRINAQLLQFVNAWNRHPLRTENGLTPLQLWNRGLLSASTQFQNDIAIGLSVGDDYGVDADMPSISQSLDTDGVVVPEVDVHLSDSEVNYLQTHYEPLRRSDSNGVDIYTEVKEYIESLH